MDVRNFMPISLAHYVWSSTTDENESISTCPRPREGAPRVPLLPLNDQRLEAKLQTHLRVPSVWLRILANHVV